MFVLMKSQTSLKMGRMGSKTRLLGQILEETCVHSRGHISSRIIMKLGQSVCLDVNTDQFENVITQRNTKFDDLVCKLGPK